MAAGIRCGVTKEEQEEHRVCSQIPPDHFFNSEGHERPGTTMRPLKFGGPNRFEMDALVYEVTKAGIDTGWKKYECRKCGEEYWKKEDFKKVKCEKCEGKGKEEGRKNGLKMGGETIGCLHVKGLVKGKGWEAVCDCGRTRYFFNGTALKRGVYKTCGQCTEKERRKNAVAVAAALGSPSSSFAGAHESAVVNDKGEDRGPRLQGIGWGSSAVVNNEADDSCANGHQHIWYKDAGEGCPLCLALIAAGF